MQIAARTENFNKSNKLKSLAQNRLFKIACSKSLLQNCLLKIAYTKSLAQNRLFKIACSKSLIQNRLFKIAYSKSLIQNPLHARFSTKQELTSLLSSAEFLIPESLTWSPICKRNKLILTQDFFILEQGREEIYFGRR